MRLGLAACTALVGLSFFSRASFADDKQACVNAHEKAQQQRNAGKLVEARQELLICGGIECPELIKQDCTQWTTEVMQTLPTVIPAAKDPAGKDLVDVKLSVDGKVVVELLDGKPVPLDPGIHQFHFESRGKTPVDQQVVVRQAEKNRIVSVTLETATAVASPKESSSRGLPVVGLVLGGVGVVTGGIALGLGLSADGDARDLRNSCAPSCSDGSVDDVRSSQNVARIVGLVGGAIFVTGVVLVILHYTGSDNASQARAIRPSANGPVLTF